MGVWEYAEDRRGAQLQVFMFPGEMLMASLGSCPVGLGTVRRIPWSMVEAMGLYDCHQLHLGLRLLTLATGLLLSADCPFVS